MSEAAVTEAAVAQALVEKLRGTRRRVGLSAILAAMRELDPRLFHSSNQRQGLLDIVQNAAAAGLLKLPASSKANYDRSARPFLPLWVTLAPAGDIVQSFDHRSHPWAPALTGLVDLRALPKPDLWLAVDTWLKRGGPAGPTLSDRERSLEIFGEEKILERELLDSPIVRLGRVQASIFNRIEEYEPLAWQVSAQAPPGAPVLVVENAATWRSLANWNTTNFGAVAYGRGNSFARAWRDLDRLLAEIGERPLLYFGDIDKEGLEIPCRANALLSAEWQHRSLRPATALYRKLLDLAPDGQPGNTLTGLDDCLLEWLGEDLSKRVLGLLTRGRRIAQEWMNAKQLKFSSGSATL